jgi:hypothetical protein
VTRYPNRSRRSVASGGIGKSGRDRGGGRRPPGRQVPARCPQDRRSAKQHPGLRPPAWTSTRTGAGTVDRDRPRTGQGGTDGGQRRAERTALAICVLSALRTSDDRPEPSGACAASPSAERVNARPAKPPALWTLGPDTGQRRPKLRLRPGTSPGHHHAQFPRSDTTMQVVILHMLFVGGRRLMDHRYQRTRFIVPSDCRS